MNWLLLSTIVSGCGCALLGAYALWFNPRKWSNRYFALLAFSISAWVFVFYWSIVDFSLFLVRLTMVIAVVWNYSLLMFTRAFIGKSVKSAFHYIFLVVSFFLIILAFTKLIFKDYKYVENLPIPEEGLLMPLFVAYALFVLCYSLILIFLEARSSTSEIKKIQSRAIFLAVAFVEIVVIVTNLLFIILLDNREYIALGMVSIMLFVGVFAYAMTRYRFLDIRAVIKKSLIYGFIMLLCAIMYSLIAFYIMSYVDISNNTYQYAFLTTIILISFIFFEILRKQVKNTIGKIFFRDEIHLTKVITESDNILNATKKIEVFTIELLKITEEVLQAPVIDIVIEQKHFGSYRSFVKKKPLSSIPFDDPAIIMMNRLDHDIVLSELIESKQYPELKKMLKKRKSEVAIPIFEEQRLLAIIFVASRDSKKIFSVQDFKRLLPVKEMAKLRIPILLRWQESVEGAKLHLKKFQE